MSADPAESEDGALDDPEGTGDDEVAGGVVDRLGGVPDRLINSDSVVEESS